MILVYSNVITNRLNYTLNVIFKYTIGVDFSLTTNRIIFENSTLPKINYSSEKIDYCLQISPIKLLFESEITKQNIEVEFYNDTPYFFKNNGNYKFDIFACTFWMITRYEEYLSFKADNHNRFNAEDSLAFKNNFLKKPVVNIWIDELKEQIQVLFPHYQFSTKKTSFINTLDIDIAYAYKAKGFIRFWGGLFKAILKKDKEDFGLRIKYLTSKEDPFDTYNFININAKNVKTEYFFLLGKKGTYDHNIHPSKKDLKKLIKNINKTNTVGIHPSYESNNNTSLIPKELGILENILNSKITQSRQHFLKMRLPETYENLISNNIRLDYTMGYASQVGFRSGICNVCPFFNLELNQQRPLWIVPFQVMDGTLNQYLNLTPKEGLAEIQELIDEVKKVNGVFVSLWHNSSLSETGIWNQWSQVYKEMLNLMK